MSRTRVLVVANLTAESPTLIDALREREEATFTLLVPKSPPARRADDRERLEQALAVWREAGLECEGALGDEDPVVAVHEIWDPRRFDEIVVSTLPGQVSQWTRWDLPHRLASLTDARVTHVVDLTRAPAPRASPPPKRERPALGPLSVLAWGGRPKTPAR